ncbi:hypothetical protein [Streptomyces sp. 8N706]|uniref:hypothetical protein n=1 Tax=Streptomyces sp. 8N706 TaxID=3457416 RepID=UPI003FD0A473
MAAIVLTAGALASAGSGSAFGVVVDDLPFSGEENTDQDGEQNLACGNSARLVRVNLGETVHRKKNCVDTDGHTARRSSHAGGAQAVGGTLFGPQVNTAQTGRQNLHCGNSADLVTVNVLGTIDEDTTCAAADHGHSRRYGPGDEYARGARTLGGASVGQQVNTAQVGRQNLHCGNSAETLTVNVMGTIRKHANCVAADHYHGSDSAVVRRGRASADAGRVAGLETNTAQNGRQNQTCGSPGGGIDLPFGEIERKARCAVRDDS